MKPRLRKMKLARYPFFEPSQPLRSDPNGFTNLSPTTPSLDTCLSSRNTEVRRSCWIRKYSPHCIGSLWTRTLFVAKGDLLTERGGKQGPTDESESPVFVSTLNMECKVRAVAPDSRRRHQKSIMLSSCVFATLHTF